MNVAEFSPIGFIKTPVPVSCMIWSPADSPRLLVCCQDGTMMEVEPPSPEDTDVSESYLVQPVSLSGRTFTSIKDRLRVSGMVACLSIPCVTDNVDYTRDLFHIQTHKHTYIYMCMHACMHAHTCVCMHACKCMHLKL